MADAGLVRESNTVATGGTGIAANNHAKWYVLLGQFDAAGFHELSLRRTPSWRTAETEASKVTRRWFDGPGAGMEKLDQLARGLLLPAEVAAWIRDRRRLLSTSATPFRPASVMAAVEATRGVVRDHRIFDRWLSGLRHAMIAPAPWQPRWAEDIPRPSLPRLTGQPLTVVSGDMGSGKSRYIRQQLARYVQHVRATEPVRLVVPLLLEAEQLPCVVAAADPWAAAVRAFLVGYSPTISIEERERLADLLVARCRAGDISMVVACDGLDELPHRTLMHLLDQASGPVVRFLRAEGASVVLGVRSGTDAERITTAFVEGASKATVEPARVGALNRAELVALARAWRVPLPPGHLAEFLARYPTALLAACGLATGATEQNDSQLLEGVVRRLFAGEWKDGAELAPPSMDSALGAAADVAFAMATDGAEWRYSASAAWVRRRATAVAGDGVLTALERLLPQLLQQHTHDVTWTHAAVQEFLVGWHLGNGMPGDKAREFLRRRWWQHAQWRRVTIHTLACTRDPQPLLDLLVTEARTDPFAVLDRLLLQCAHVVPVSEPARLDALTRLRPQATALVPISRRFHSYRDSMPDGLKRVPELLRSHGSNAFTGCGVADFLYPQLEWEIKHHNSTGEPIRHHFSPLFVSALRAGFPVAVRLFRQCAGLVSPAVPMGVFFNAAEIVAAAAPWIETTELFLLNDPSRKHPWIKGEARFAITTELWARGVTVRISQLARRAELGLLMANLGPVDTARLLSSTCGSPAAGSQCSRDELSSTADETIAQAGTDQLTALLDESSITAPMRVAVALQLMRRGQALAREAVTSECVAQTLAHRCRSSTSRAQAIELLDGLLYDRQFGWAQDALAGATSVAVVRVLARHGRRRAARAVLDRVLAETGRYGLGLLPVLEFDIDLTEPQVVDLLQRTHHSGDGADGEDRERIHRALRRIGPDARRAVWQYAAPNGFVRSYVEAGYQIEKWMLHEVLSLEELRDAVQSAPTTERALQLLRSVLRVSPPEARNLAAEIAGTGWEEHLARCSSHMSCRFFRGLSELFPTDIREQVAIHGEGLELIAVGRYDLMSHWRPNQTVLGRMNAHRPVAEALAVAAANDTAGLDRLKELALHDDDYESALAKASPAVGRSVMESRIASKEVVLDHNRAYRLFTLGSPQGIDWYAQAIATSSRGSIPWSHARTADAPTALAAMCRLLQEWASRTDIEAKANLAAAMYDAWNSWSELLTPEGADEIRRALASHAPDIAASLASLGTRHIPEAVHAVFAPHSTPAT
ncbi:hypothetical protein AB0D14_44025 [Streptomyces sp. NPDC048484]|uniref:hypothetical protein n=1 Tax=Streptomyces sp. NPDC048484 TaxID=3155146 RepID=UPI00341B6F25